MKTYLSGSGTSFRKLRSSSPKVLQLQPLAIQPPAPTKTEEHAGSILGRPALINSQEPAPQHIDSFGCCACAHRGTSGITCACLPAGLTITDARYTLGTRVIYRGWGLSVPRITDGDRGEWWAHVSSDEEPCFLFLCVRWFVSSARDFLLSICSNIWQGVCVYKKLRNLGAL